MVINETMLITTGGKQAAFLCIALHQPHSIIVSLTTIQISGAHRCSESITSAFPLPVISLFITNYMIMGVNFTLQLAVLGNNINRYFGHLEIPSIWLVFLMLRSMIFSIR